MSQYFRSQANFYQCQQLVYFYEIIYSILAVKQKYGKTPAVKVYNINLSSESTKSPLLIWNLFLEAYKQSNH